MFPVRTNQSRRVLECRSTPGNASPERSALAFGRTASMSSRMSVPAGSVRSCEGGVSERGQGEVEHEIVRQQGDLECRKIAELGAHEVFMGHHAVRCVAFAFQKIELVYTQHLLNGWDNDARYVRIW